MGTSRRIWPIAVCATLAACISNADTIELEVRVTGQGLVEYTLGGESSQCAGSPDQQAQCPILFENDGRDFQLALRATPAEGWELQGFEGACVSPLPVVFGGRSVPTDWDCADPHVCCSSTDDDVEYAVRFVSIEPPGDVGPDAPEDASPGDASGDAPTDAEDATSVDTTDSGVPDGGLDAAADAGPPSAFTLTCPPSSAVEVGREAGMLVTEFDPTTVDRFRVVAASVSGTGEVELPGGTFADGSWTFSPASVSTIVVRGALVGDVTLTLTSERGSATSAGQNCSIDVEPPTSLADDTIGVGWTVEDVTTAPEGTATDDGGADERCVSLFVPEWSVEWVDAHGDGFPEGPSATGALLFTGGPTDLPSLGLSPSASAFIAWMMRYEIQSTSEPAEGVPNVRVRFVVRQDGAFFSASPVWGGDRDPGTMFRHAVEMSASTLQALGGTSFDGSGTAPPVEAGWLIHLAPERVGAGPHRVRFCFDDFSLEVTE